VVNTFEGFQNRKSTGYWAVLRSWCSGKSQSRLKQV